MASYSPLNVTLPTIIPLSEANNTMVSTSAVSSKPVSEPVSEPVSGSHKK